MKHCSVGQIVEVTISQDGSVVQFKDDLDIEFNWQTYQYRVHPADLDRLARALNNAQMRVSFDATGRQTWTRNVE